jgi:tetratricopeptide (TPR) repeat protein
MTLLQGIQLHELIMMILGFILGLTLIFVFLFTALKNKPNLKLLYGFAAPVVMIGYPSFRSVEFKNDVLKIDKLVEQVNLNPTDTVAQRALIQSIQTLPASRCKTSADAMTAIANTQAAFGQYDSAKVTIQKALDLDKTSPKAVESQKDIVDKWKIQKKTEQSIQQIENVVKQMEAKPNDSKLRDSLRAHFTRLENTTDRPVHIDNSKLIVLANAASVLDENNEAKALTEDILKNNPNPKVQNDAVILKEKIKSKDSNKRVKPTNKPSVPNKSAPNSRSVEVVPAPAAVYQDTARLFNKLIPKSGAALEVKRFWNAKE